jgi:hypothetical protein
MKQVELRGLGFNSGRPIKELMNSLMNPRFSSDFLKIPQIFSKLRNENLKQCCFQ